MDKISGRHIAISFLSLIMLTIIFGFISPQISGGFLCLFFMAAYYGLVCCTLKICEINAFDVFLKEKFQFLIISALFTAFVMSEVMSVQAIRIWDALEIWDPALRCRELVFSDPFGALKELHHSINHYDYNHLLPMLLVLPMVIFGKSFAAYVLSVWICFALPAAFLMVLGAKKILDKFEISLSPAKIFFIALLIPTFEFALINGYANVSILIPGSLMTILLLTSLEEKFQFKETTLTAFLAVLAVLQARTAAYMVVACFFGYALCIIYSGISEGNLKEKIVALTKKYLYMCCFCIAFLLIFFNNFVMRAFLYDIKTAYVAYTLGQDYIERLFSQIVFFGIIPFGVFLIAVIFGIKNKITRKYAIFSLFWTVVSVVLFCRIQVMGQQHQYIMLIPAILTIALFSVYLLNKHKRFGVTVILLLAISFANGFSGFLPRYFGAVHIPEVRNDIKDVKAIVSYLDSITKDTDKKIYFIASSGAYNGGTLQKSLMPEKFDALPNLFWTPDVDLRDGFSAEFFDADIVAFIDPVQTHLLPEYQCTVVYLYNAMTSDNQLSRHFKEIKSYSLLPQENRQVTFRIFEKISPIEKSDVDFLEKVFVERYPEHNNLFKDRFEKYKSEHFKEGGDKK